jgi:ABC-type nitrate/sulfonate/bicarbonate transport system ATPase subunit
MSKLSAHGLGKTFLGREGDVRALEGVELEVGEGEFVSIVGPSGCGKSTLLNILAGLTEPGEGHVLLDGAEPPTLLGRVGYMPQSDLLMPWRTVLDNVTLGLEIKGLSRRAARERARHELHRFGLEGFEGQWPSAISGGMRQRAALLRTFLAGRDVMLLDEPFGALDALTRKTMQEWLLDIWQTAAKTILFVTHDVEEAVLLSDRVYVMSGRPGRMQLCLAVELPRPRHLQDVLAPEFLAYKAKLMRPLQEASQRETGVFA